MAAAHSAVQSDTITKPEVDGSDAIRAASSTSQLAAFSFGR